MYRSRDTRSLVTKTGDGLFMLVSPLLWLVFMVVQGVGKTKKFYVSFMRNRRTSFAGCEQWEQSRRAGDALTRKV